MKTENMTTYERRAMPSLRGFILHADSGLGHYTHDYPTMGEQRRKLASLIKSARVLNAQVKRVLSAERPWSRIYRLGKLRVTLFARES